MTRDLSLLIDVGNTNIKLGLADDDTLLDFFVLPTDLTQTPDSLGLRIMEACRFLSVNPGEIRRWIVSSVVPAANPILRNAARRFCRAAKVLFVPEDIALPLENHYARPNEVGSDRLVTAYAARALYPDACSLIVVDFGTATTFDCVKRNSYLGGLICPGVLSSARALSGQTAKLPQISLDLESEEIQIGKSTSQSLNQGFVFGFASMIEGVTARLSKLLDGEILVVGTGGFAEPLSRVTNALDEIRTDLLLQGLLLAKDL